MEKKPITTLLKVTAIIHLVLSVLGILTSLLSIVSYALLPGLSSLVGETTGMEFTPLTWISIVIGLICCVIDTYLSILALKHQKLKMVYQVSIFTMLAAEVFNGVQIHGVGDVISLIIGLALPLLFIYAVYGQLKLDGDLPGKKKND